MFPKAVQDNLIKFYNLEEADDAAKKEFLSSFEELSSQVVLDIILKELNDNDAKVFLQAAAQDQTGEKAIEFARQKIQNLDSKISTRLLEEINLLNLNK